ILGSYPSSTRKCSGLRKILYFLTIFFSKVANATRSFSADGPTMVPASSRMIQSFFAMLSGWTGMYWIGTFLRKRPIVLLLSDRKLYSTSGYTAAYAGTTVRLQQWSSARPATSPLSSAHAPSAAMKRTGKHFGFVPLADKCTAIYKVNGNLPDQLV